VFTGDKIVVKEGKRLGYGCIVICFNFYLDLSLELHERYSIQVIDVFLHSCDLHNEHTRLRCDRLHFWVKCVELKKVMYLVYLYFSNVLSVSSTTQFLIQGRPQSKTHCCSLCILLRHAENQGIIWSWAFQKNVMPLEASSMFFQMPIVTFYHRKWMKSAAVFMLCKALGEKLSTKFGPSPYSSKSWTQVIVHEYWSDLLHHPLSTGLVNNISFPSNSHTHPSPNINPYTC
jgi:hypothetical protein